MTRNLNLSLTSWRSIQGFYNYKELSTTAIPELYIWFPLSPQGDRMISVDDVYFFLSISSNYFYFASIPKQYIRKAVSRATNDIHIHKNNRYFHPHPIWPCGVAFDTVDFSLLFEILFPWLQLAHNTCFSSDQLLHLIPCINLSSPTWKKCRTWSKPGPGLFLFSLHSPCPLTLPLNSLLISQSLIQTPPLDNSF